jgi:tRNA U54 and U55 pseudouridine synthase Pus10
VLGDDLAGRAALEAGREGEGEREREATLAAVAQEILDRFPLILSVQWRNTLDTRAVRGARHLVRGRDLKRAMLVGGPALGAVVLSREAAAQEFVADLRRDWPNCDPRRWTVDVTLVRNSIFIIGRYAKYRRDISQTPWDVGKARMDVESCLGPVLKKLTGARVVLFSSAGREDCNVRMLGNGRPFAMELKGVRSCRPLLPAALRALQAELNEKYAGDVGFSHLQVGSRAGVKKYMLDGASERTKSYRALVRLLDAPATDADVSFRLSEPLVIHQSTPLRVAHRRALLRRPKTIFDLQVSRVGEDLLAVQLTTQGGTYIKEFVHGDFGRSSPSLPDLLPGPATRADLLLLDVVYVDCEYEELNGEEEK